MQELAAGKRLIIAPIKVRVAGSLPLVETDSRLASGGTVGSNRKTGESNNKF
jgi:hypothetical protein